ncbi:phage head closure protein [Alkaliphilus transvaalensis]|uniref:phage head closure protein n=1 Tax=Alkaliphilus transvaalensis TaxID=114628 RepID=UPI00047C4177|nr:phage head closure protein [Alkaliphilus transvaalensis]
MEIGALRHRITFQKKTIAINHNGFEIETWEDVKSIWSAASNLHGREFYEAAQVKAEHTVKFTFRYLKGIDPSMEIRFNGKRYNIIAIDNIKYKNRFIEVRAQEVMPSG